MQMGVEWRPKIRKDIQLVIKLFLFVGRHSFCHSEVYMYVCVKSLTCLSLAACGHSLQAIATAFVCLCRPANCLTLLLPNHNLSNIPAKIATTTTWPELLCVVAPYHKRIELMVSPLTNLCNRCVIAIMNGMIQKLIVAQSCSPTNKISHNNTYIYMNPCFCVLTNLCVCVFVCTPLWSIRWARTYTCLKLVITFHPTIVK